MVNFVVFFQQQFYFFETVASVTVLFFVDVVAGISNCVDNGLEVIAVVVGCRFQ